MKNELDTDYFAKKLELIQRDLLWYSAEELARELARLSKTADAKVLTEPEFN